MNVEIRDERFRRVVGDDAPLERLGTGFQFTEGPIWHPTEHHLTFSDMPGDEMRRWSAPTGVRSFRKPSNKANGNTYDRHGRMLTCEHATSRVTRTGLDGRIAVLATHYQGRELNSPNDIVVSARRLHLLHRSDLWPDAGFRRAACAGTRLPRRLSPVRRRRRARSSSPTISPSRTASASRATKAGST